VLEIKHRHSFKWRNL